MTLRSLISRAFRGKMGAQDGPEPLATIRGLADQTLQESDRPMASIVPCTAPTQGGIV